LGPALLLAFTLAFTLFSLVHQTLLFAFTFNALLLSLLSEHLSLALLLLKLSITSCIAFHLLLFTSFTLTRIVTRLDVGLKVGKLVSGISLQALLMLRTAMWGGHHSSISIFL